MDNFWSNLDLKPIKKGVSQNLQSEKREAMSTEQQLDPLENVKIKIGIYKYNSLNIL